MPQRLGAELPSARRTKDEKGGMRQLHCAPEESDFSGQHQARALDEALLEKLRIEEGRRHLGPPITERDNKVLALWRPVRPFDFRLRDDVDEGYVLTFLEVHSLVEHGHSVAVLAWVVPQQVVDGADTEVLLERSGGFLAEDVIQPVGQYGHRYSTPMSKASPRWSV